LGDDTTLNKIKESPLVKKVGINRVVLVIVLILMYLFFCIVTKGKFKGINRIVNAMNYAYFLGFLSLGVTFVIATGGIDFSIGPVMFCCALISGYCLNSYGVPMWLCLIISIIVGHSIWTFQRMARFISVCCPIHRFNG
jgi:Ribose/xylose/arabinose/galactoside ABC-type transport systems, permease components